MATTVGARRDPELLEVPERLLLMADGSGDPNAPAFQTAVGALFTLSYSLKFQLKRELGLDRKVGPLEGLWWVDDGPFSFEDRSSWRWTAMIEQPEEATTAAIDALAREGSLEGRTRLERFVEGRVAQILHVGPFADEPRTIERLHAFIAEQELRAVGRHHEIYLSDVRRTSPERLRTVIRQPVTS